MITALIAGCLVWCAIKILERGQDSLIDDWAAFGFVLVPALVIWLLSILGSILGFHPFLILLALPLYFLFATLMLKYAYEFKWRRACGYGVVVFVIAVIVEYGIAYGLERYYA